MTLALGLVHSCRALLLCQRWRMNKFSNFKIHWCICSHCQKRTDKYKINLAYRPICWQHILWPLPGTGAGGTTGASWGHQTYQQVFCKATQIRSSGLAIHTSGLNCHWLKVIIALEVMVFWHHASSAFVAVKLACLAVSLQWPQAKVSTTIASHTRLRPMYQGPKVNPSSLLSFVRPTGSKVEWRLMRVNDLLSRVVESEVFG